MPTVAVKCPYCGAAAGMAFGQAARGCDLRWWESFACRACGTRTEADGGEDMPQEHRAVLLEQEGRWSVTTEGRPSLGWLRAARECLGLSVGELPALKARLPGALATGTRSEMEVLVGRLHRASGSAAPVKVVPAEPGAAPDWPGTTPFPGP
jgi:hypothetical protein